MESASCPGLASEQLLSDLKSGWQPALALVQLSAKFACFSPPDGDGLLQRQCHGCLSVYCCVRTPNLSHVQFWW